MSIIDHIFKKRKENLGLLSSAGRKTAGNAWDVSRFAFVDAEVGLRDHKVHDIGAVRYDGAIFHQASKQGLVAFLKNGKVDFVCGHNIVHHDAKYLFDGSALSGGNVLNPFARGRLGWSLVDTLYMSPLLFPERPYHRLVKDDKLVCDQVNNPVNDCEKARELLADEIARWNALTRERKQVFVSLLGDKEEFVGFFRMTETESLALRKAELSQLIGAVYNGRICSLADLDGLILKCPCALAYALALIDTADSHSVTPGWVLHNYPEVEHVIKTLRHTRCAGGCDYCSQELDVRHNLKRLFGFDAFRTYNGEPLQERAARAAVDGKSLLAIFPTGGGKSLTFQLPALMEGHSVHGLTVVISPLQSLMKDQVDSLAGRGITDAVTINGLLDPIARSSAIKQVVDGEASLLYIAPEMLRSKTVERILMARHVVRFVIDEAHCFSAWGQDFRVDYLYIGKFIKEYQARKGENTRIPVSCFTATAKQKVVQDICDYFKQWLGADLELFASSASRTNLRYSVIHVDTDEDKYTRLRSLVKAARCPTIVYVSRTKRTWELAARLTRDGVKALPYNGKMSADEKIGNQDAFMNDHVGVIVATSAFGMGVDKSDVGLVVHYDISDSLENYVQEAGRAGRDPHIDARCFVLYSDNDLDKHFVLLNQTKLSISEIQQVWKAVKNFTKQRPHVCCSALEIARQAGWDDSVTDIETRVRTALSALEQSGYIERGNNVPHVYATGITVRNMDEARKRLTDSSLFSADEIESAVRIIKSLISQKSVAKAQDADAESRVDYLADILGLSKKEVVSAVNRMRQDGILADTHDLSAYLQDMGGTQKKSMLTLDRFAKLERYILEHIPDDSLRISYKQLNDNAVRDGIATSTEKSLRTLLYFLAVKGYARKKEDGARNMVVTRHGDIEATIGRYERRIGICRFVIEWLYQLAEKGESAVATQNFQREGSVKVSETEGGEVQFSVVELLKEIKSGNDPLFNNLVEVQLEDVEEALLYLSKIGALKLEGGFLVLYNAMDIRRLKDNRLRYKQDDYRMLNEFYKQKIQQIHIVGEYANLMVRDYDAALQYVQDYFQMNYRLFVDKYFKGDREAEIERNLTPAKYRQLFGQLSKRQKEIVCDRESRCIVVAAGPGSGKTRVLVHKLASLLLLEDVKHEQLLMLTFSRTAATEFKQRLVQLIGNAAHYVEIKTFHSYCFDLLGRVGNLNDAGNVVRRAAEMIDEGEVEPNRIGKSVLVIDEAQDMGADDYALVTALMRANEEMRVIAVGDDDQNIYEFRGSDSRYFYQLSKVSGGRLIEMTENYRSLSHIVQAANDLSSRVRQRIKQTPIVPVNKGEGLVKVIRHEASQSQACMFQPVAESVISHPKAKGETTCVLTQTNEEAVIMLALLHRRGVQAKLVQSMDGLRFLNLAEVRYFLRCVDRGGKAAKSPLISDEVWTVAKSKTFSKYAVSSSLAYLRRCLQLFEQTSHAKYYSDFREFVFESSVEDFCDVSGAGLVVSTIHKAKGWEFDHVVMLVSVPVCLSDEVLRRYYVAMTRAKQTLTIHTDGKLFDGIYADSHISDGKVYAMPNEIVLQLSYKDVNLGFSKNCKLDILALYGGASLIYHDHRFSVPSTGRDIAMLSQKMQEKLGKWEAKGYHVTVAKIRFIVAWKPKGAPKEEEESAVPLIDLVMRKGFR